MILFSVFPSHDLPHLGLCLTLLTLTGPDPDRALCHSHVVPGVWGGGCPATPSLRCSIAGAAGQVMPAQGSHRSWSPGRSWLSLHPHGLKSATIFFY